NPEQWHDGRVSTRALSYDKWFSLSRRIGDASIDCSARPGVQRLMRLIRIEARVGHRAPERPHRRLGPQRRHSYERSTKRKGDPSGAARPRIRRAEGRLRRAWDSVTDV